MFSANLVTISSTIWMQELAAQTFSRNNYLFGLSRTTKWTFHRKLYSRKKFAYYKKWSTIERFEFDGLRL